MKWAPFLLLISLQAMALDKPSLKSFGEKLRDGDVIVNLFKTSADLSAKPKLGAVWARNSKNLRALETEFNRSTPFVRGEVENEKVLNALIQMLQLSILKVRELAAHNKWSEAGNHLSSWFLFAADLPYEESSLVGLRVAGVLRSLLLDEIESLQKKYGPQMARGGEIRKWFLGVRAPWPVDRVFIFEAKRLLNPAMMSVANAAASHFQKNPYQTSAQALKGVRGGQASEAELLKQIWKDSDIVMMKTEITRIGKLKLRLAQDEYLWKKKVAAKSAQELLKERLIDQIPVDYFTGSPLDLTSL